MRSPPDEALKSDSQKTVPGGHGHLSEQSRTMCRQAADRRACGSGPRPCRMTAARAREHEVSFVRAGGIPGGVSSLLDPCPPQSWLSL